MDIIAACLHKGDRILIDDEPVTIAKAEYSTPVAGTITFTMTDGRPFALSAVAEITLLQEDH